MKEPEEETEDITEDEEKLIDKNKHSRWNQWVKDDLDTPATQEKNKVQEHLNEQSSTTPKSEQGTEPKAHNNTELKHTTSTGDKATTSTGTKENKVQH
ncbi:hypothetical protein HYE00_03890 [Mycoplasmopsis bovis]|nr:hypothetical protein [Mycoplasmopsis bovis]QQH28811.1 hypothetical protein HYE00_03890 [Mycoplasmopsis bovis]